MGNLCSSGTDRSEKKKEEAQLPDKPLDGEDEALLSKVAEGVNVAANEDGDGGGGGGGLGGMVGDVMSSGKTAVAEVVSEAKAEAEEVGDKAVDKGKELAGEIKDAAVSGIGQVVSGVKDKGSEVADDAQNKAESAVEDVKESGSQAVDEASKATTTAVHSAEDKLTDVSTDVTNSVEETKKDFAQAGDDVSSGASALKQDAFSAVHAAQTEGENLQSQAENAAEDNTAAVESIAKSGEEESKLGFVEGIKQNVSQKVEEAKEVAEEKVEDAKQTAENRLNEAVESAKASALSALSSVTGSVDEKGVSEAGDSVNAGLGDLSSQAAAAESSVGAGVEASKDEAVSEMESLKTDAKGLAQEAEAASEDKVSAVCVGDLKSAADENVSALGGLADFSGAGLSGQFQSFTDKAETSAENASKEVEAGVEEAAVMAKQAVSECTPAKEEQPQPDTSESPGLVGFAKDSVQAGVGFVGEKVVNKVHDLFGNDDKGQEDESMKEEETEEDGDNYLDKAKSLLEQHRNSIDESKMAAVVSEVGMAVSDTAGNNNNNEMDFNGPGSIADEVTDKVREEAARDFVEDIIEKATTIVSESATDEAGESADEDQTVERGEETLEVKKKGVCFVSPQISDTSSSPLSSPPEILPSPEITSPPAVDIESPASSISQGELVERDIELELPSPPPSMQQSDADVPASPDNNEGEDSIMQDVDDDVAPPPLDNRPEIREDDESLQRVAMEVTTKAVQDAIKIVTENGTGVALSLNNNDNDNNNSELVNNLEASSPSSDDREREEEDMTTTNSSQVERGSSVSDLTDNSQPGSITESLSSYDPGAVYRQDLADLSDALSGKSSSPMEFEPVPAAGKEADIGGKIELSSTTSAAMTVDMSGLQGLEGNVSGAETPTPTNVTNFADGYPSPPSQEEMISNDPVQNNNQTTSKTADNNVEDLPPPPPPPPTASETVPSSLPDIDLNLSSSSKPTIVINSPDSAPNTNGSTEDVSASTQSEALI